MYGATSPRFASTRLRPTVRHDKSKGTVQAVPFFYDRLFIIRLVIWMRLLEGFQFLAGIMDSHDGRIGRHIAIKSLGVVNLRYQKNIGEA